MTHFLSRIKKGAAAFLKNEDGNGTIELLVALPVTMLVFSFGYEGGLSSVRQVLLQHGLETTVRDVRIGAIPNPTHQVLIENICAEASLIKDCTNQVRLEMIPGQIEGWDDATLAGEATCRDRSSPSDPVVEFTNTGGNNDLMFLRACALFDPIFPTIGFGKAIATESGPSYALFATSGYVTEPFQ